MDKETKILKAIMKRYNGLTPLREALQDDTDTVLENLSDDIGIKFHNEGTHKYVFKVTFGMTNGQK